MRTDFFNISNQFLIEDNNMELVEIRKKLKKVQDKDRYEHTKGVMYTAGCLARHTARYAESHACRSAP